MRSLPTRPPGSTARWSYCSLFRVLLVTVAVFLVSEAWEVTTFTTMFGRSTGRSAAPTPPPLSPLPSPPPSPPPPPPLRERIALYSIAIGLRARMNAVSMLVSYARHSGLPARAYVVTDSSEFFDALADELDDAAVAHAVRERVRFVTYSHEQHAVTNIPGVLLPEPSDTLRAKIRNRTWGAATSLPKSLKMAALDVVDERFDVVVYCDSDMAIGGPIDDYVAVLLAQARLRADLSGGGRDDTSLFMFPDRDMYNGGMFVVRRTRDARRVLAEWAHQVLHVTAYRDQQALLHGLAEHPDYRRAIFRVSLSTSPFAQRDGFDSMDFVEPAMVDPKKSPPPAAVFLHMTYFRTSKLGPAAAAALTRYTYDHYTTPLWLLHGVNVPSCALFEPGHTTPSTAQLEHEARIGAHRFRLAIDWLAVTANMSVVDAVGNCTNDFITTDKCYVPPPVPPPAER